MFVFTRSFRPRATTLSVANFFTSLVAVLSATLIGVLSQPLPDRFPILGLIIVLVSVIPLFLLARKRSVAI